MDQTNCFLRGWCAVGDIMDKYTILRNATGDGSFINSLIGSILIAIYHNTNNIGCAWYMVKKDRNQQNDIILRFCCIPVNFQGGENDPEYLEDIALSDIFKRMGTIWTTNRYIDYSLHLDNSNEYK